MQIGKTNFQFARNLVLPEQEAAEINQLSHSKLAPTFSFSDEILLIVAREEIKIEPFHEQIFNSTVKNLIPDNEKPSPGQTIVTEMQCKTKTGKTPMIVAPVIAKVFDVEGASVIPMRVINLSPAPLIINKGRVLTRPSYAPPEFQQMPPNKETEAPPFSINSLGTKTPKQPIQSNDFQIGEEYNHLKREVLELVNEFRDTFALDGEKSGITTIMRHKIRTSDEEPVYRPQYCIPHVHQDKLDEEIDKMLEDDIIELSKSPYNSPIVVVPKKDGSLRLCVDFSALNKKIVADQYPLPVIGEVLENLANANVFSTLDALSGFWQVELEESSKEKTAFSTRTEHYHFTVLPFGLKDARNSFERAAITALSDLIGNSVLVYLDDLIIASKGTENHFQKLRKVLKKLQAANFT